MHLPGRGTERKPKKKKPPSIRKSFLSPDSNTEPPAHEATAQPTAVYYKQYT
jgi:hypothetical protein